jgi:hypothetical protein
LILLTAKRKSRKAGIQTLSNRERAPGFSKVQHASDEEVQNAILTFHKLALICYQVFCREEQAMEMQKAA